MAAATPLPSLCQRLRNGDSLLGTFVKASDPSVAELLASAGLDYLIVDLEHSSLALSTIVEIIRAAELWHVPVLVRFSPERVAEAGVVLEAGAAGIQVTRISTPETLAAVRRAVSLPPDGDLGLSLSHRAARFGGRGASEYLARIRDEVAIVAQIESRAGVDSLPELLATNPPPDAWFLGPVDLSVDLGHPAEVGHPEVQAMLSHAAQLILATGQRLSVFAGDIEDACRWRDRGATAVTLGSDFTLLAAQVAGAVEAWRGRDTASPGAG
jgi:4-hydroxy-2-oxoheptanedioate aldolase